MRFVVFVVLLGGCRQLLGFESPTAGADAAGPDSAVVNPDGAPDSVDAPPGMMFVITFQQGDIATNYSGTRDTYLAQGDTTANDTETLVRYRQADRFALLAFDNLFGPAAIPAGATIVAAYLDVNVNNPGSAGGTMSESATAWAVNVTYDDFGATAGVTAEDLGVPVGPSPGEMQGVNTVEVTDSIQAWAAGARPNNGWIIEAGNGGGDTSFRSSEDTAPANRPKLSVTYRK